MDIGKGGKAHGRMGDAPRMNEDRRRDEARRNGEKGQGGDEVERVGAEGGSRAACHTSRSIRFACF